MPLDTNLSQSPYFDDFNEAAEYYRVLFKPGVSVQVRELNQLQSILQNQIERFGSHVFKNGTIVSGVNFRYIPNYQYVKILDLQVDGQPAIPSGYVNYFVKNSANLQARVVNSRDGFQSKTPDLNTLFLQYVNSGNTSETTTYSLSDTLTVFSPDYPVFSVDVNNGGSGFSNSDLVVFVSALSVNVTSGSFTAGETIVQASTNAHAQVIEVDSTSFDNVVLKIKPLPADLANTSSGTSLAAWGFDPGLNVTGSITGAVASVLGNLGAGAIATPITDSLGVVIDVVVSGTSGTGSDYIVPPHVTIKPTSNTATISTLDLSGVTYKAQVTVANSSFAAPVGNGYAFAVTDGLIYQKGAFLKVDPQVIIVNAYSSTPNNVSVGFTTIESIESVNTNTALYDNAANTTNYNAPGADRLKMVPQLIVVDSTVAASNADFLALVEFKDGEAYKENRTSVYNNLGQEFARRTSETNGNFVVDQFLTVTKDKPEVNTTHNYVVSDPGLGYISGYRVETLKNTYVPQRKGTDTLVRTNQAITANYGNYVRVQEVAGVYGFKSGDVVSLYDTANQYITNRQFAVGGTIMPTGSVIGTAKIRSLVYESGEPGSPSAVYKLYLFDIQMSYGYNFRDVKTVYYGGAFNGIADVVQELSATTNTYVTVIKDANLNNLLFSTGLQAVKNANNITYTYRTCNEGCTLNADGTIDITLAATGENFPYTPTSQLSSAQKQEIVVVPLSNTQATTTAVGTVVTSTSNTVLVGTSTTFIGTVAVGDYILLTGNSVQTDVRRIISVANNTSITLDANVAFANNAAKVRKFFPAMYPIPLASRSDRVANTGAFSKSLTINLNTTVTSCNVAVCYNVTRTNAQETIKTVNRDQFVSIDVSTNAGGVYGPWALGVSDVVRLKAVYLGSNTSSQDVTKHFYVDQGNDGNFNGMSYLVKRTNSSLVFGSSQTLLVKFDYFTQSTGGFHTVASYSIDDTKTLDQSSNTVNTFEIPEIITSDHKYYDLRDTFDYRPSIVSTATPDTDPDLAPVNPADTQAFDALEKYFPVPDSTISFDAEAYLPRVDRFVVTKDGTFSVLEGSPTLNSPVPPPRPTDSITVSLIDVRPYPSIPLQISNTSLQIINKGVGDAGGEFKQRVNEFTVQPKRFATEDSSQPKTYTMHDIGNIERRVTNLEYYVSLNLLEQNIKDLTIPSSVTPGVNRFKNGFYVDNFDDYTNVDLQNKEFFATIAQARGELQPFTKQLNLASMFNRSDNTTNSAIYGATSGIVDMDKGSLLLPYMEEELINQPLSSSVVNSDGVQTTFNGSMTVTPSTFAIKIRGEVKFTPDPVSQSSGGGGGGTFYLCTLLRDLGYMDDEMWEADGRYGWKIRNKQPEVFVGYEMWAKPLADWIREGLAENKLSAKIVLNIVKPFILSWAEYMAREEGYDRKFNPLGFVVMKVGYPLCKALGVVHGAFAKLINRARA